MAMDSTLPAPLVIAPRNGVPVLLSIPHSGRDYPDWLLREARHGRRALQTLEDPLVDRLAWRALAAGFGAVIARTPRGVIDCNRSSDELDPASVVTDHNLPFAPLGPRARHGLGIIASRTHRHGPLWRAPLPIDRFERRLATVHTAYHDALDTELARLVKEHGTALLLDLHSMPPTHREPIVIGDRHGASAARWLADAAAQIATRSGFRAIRNDPYAGGYIVERHGRPATGTHALQVELDRSVYLARDLLSPGTGFDRASHLLLALAEGLAECLAAPTVIAAE
jgi:N-formylglutamate amidohydrolase